MPPSPSDHRHRTLTNDWLDGSTRFQSRKEYIEYSVTTLRLAPTVANSLADELEEIHEECRCPLPSGLSVKLADERAPSPPPPPPGSVARGRSY
ncbi:hypothetical protein RQP46_008531 [Phenoliferia psychrophenolica]